MKKTAFAVALLSVSALASCSNTFNGIKKDAHDMVSWAHDRPSPVNQTAMGEAPVGYRIVPLPKTQTAAPPKVQPVPPAPQETDIVALTPPTPAAPAAPLQPLDITATPVLHLHVKKGSSNLVWHDIRHYNAADPSLPADHASAPPQPSPPQPIVQYNASVDVYPVDGDLAPYTQMNSVSSRYNGDNSYENARVEQIYFPYGSAQVAAIDRKNLRELARSLVRQTKNYRLTIVGHASRSVKGVKDPLRKKLINFRMAQKRADAVAHVLIKSGAAPGWVEATSVGAGQPAKHLHGKSQQAADQRADVLLNAN